MKHWTADSRWTLVFGIVCWLIVSASGCGGQHDAAVSGVAYLDDQPLSNGMVTFHPTGGGAAAYGQIDASGRYELRTGDASGLKPGEYRVTVMATEPVVEAGPGQAPAIPRPITPDRYRDFATTDIVEEIAAGSNQIDIRLTTTPSS